MSKFSPTAAISFGWNTFLKSGGFLIVLQLIPFAILIGFVILLVILMPFFLLLGEDFSSILSILFFLWLLVFYYLILALSLGMIKATMNLVDKGNGQLSDAFIYVKDFKRVVKYILTVLLVNLIVFVGFIFLIIPGIYFSIRLSQAMYFLVDKNLGPIDSISASWNVTKGNILNLIGFGLLSCLVLFAGFMLFGIGSFIAMPVTMVASVYVYRKLSGSTEQPEPVPAVDATPVIEVPPIVEAAPQTQG